MSNINKIKWFEVRGGGVSKSFGTLKEAMNDLEEMTKGYPLTKHMTEANHNYWKKCSKETVICRITQESHIITKPCK